MNTITAFQRHLIVGASAALVFLASASAAPNRITAELDRPSLPLGESAQLTVTVQGSQPGEPSVPAVDGLEITSVGQQSSMQVIKGVVSAATRYVYRITPDRAGSFIIPAIGLPGGGSTRPLAFRVDAIPNGQNSRSPSPNGIPLPTPNGRPAEDESGADTKGQRAFLRVVLPKQELTVGELVPVEIKACFPVGTAASLNGLPMLAGGPFALNKLGDNPRETREMIDGQPYNVITWSSELSAVEAGDHPLNLELPVMVRVQEKGTLGGRNPFKDFFGDASPFDDSVADDFFGQATEKPLTLHSDGASLKIRPLPLEGRPADFSGAVGNFDVSAEASVTKAVAGDPVSLKMKITGQGNFDRVTSNGLVTNAIWKSYKPNARFEPADRDGLAGAKTFEQAIVPIKTGASEIPALSFSYFNPETHSYVTKTTSPIPIEIVPGSAIASAPVPTATLAAAAPAPAASGPVPAATLATARSTDGLVPDHPGTGPVANLRPVVLAPWFLIVNALMATATIICLLVRRWRRSWANDPQRLRVATAEAAVRAAISAMDEAIANRNGPGFFHAARRAVTERLAQRWSVPLSRVTSAEIRARLNGSEDRIFALFQRGDEVAYSHEEVSTGELAQWRDSITQQLAQL